MRKLTIEEQTFTLGGVAKPADCLGGVLVGLVAGAGTGFSVGKYFSFVGIGWGTAIGAVSGALIGAYTGGCFD
jgi:hypothetical protein